MKTARLPTGGDGSVSSAFLAAQLRSGPIRSMLDRVVRSAAEMTGIPFMVLGIRYGDVYEFISTQGLPLTHYRDRVPAAVLGTKLFAREVEVSDLQQQPQFAALGIAPIAKTWRYGGSCPVRLTQRLNDDGVLALSCADTKRRPVGGPTLATLRQHAEFISDLIWLSNQVRQPDIVSDPATVVSTVLRAAVAQVRLPVCIIDEDRRILGQSEAFASVVREIGGQRPQIGERVGGGWLAKPVQEEIGVALSSDETKWALPITGTGNSRQAFDLFPFSFGDLGKFAVFSIHRGKDDIAAAATSLPTLELPGDGAGPLTRFLDETLIRSQRLHQRRDTSYVAIRRWRSAIKPHQIAALRALKSDVPDAFVAGIAAELASAVRTVYGSPKHCVVVPVPCGSSGPNCLSCRLAHALAATLSLETSEAFAPLVSKGKSSHPKKNASRARMRLTEEFDRPVILVDDVATSGSHINEAAKLLRASAPSVWPVVWIGP